LGFVQPLRSLIARVRALPPGRADALLAGVLLIEGVAEVASFAKLDASRMAVVFALLAVMALALAFRRRFPLTVLIVVYAVQPAMELFGRDLVDRIAGPFFWLLLAGYTLGARTEGRRLWVGVAYAVAAVLISTAVDPYDDDFTSYLSSVCLIALGPILFGQALANRTRLNLALHAKAERAERERADAADAAALAERTRIAGELHDVVAHALSAMTVQASAARRMTERDPERAETAFSIVETTGREALTELRRLLGVLRREDEELGLAPQPSLAHITSLVQRVRAAGLRVELRVDGEPVALPAGVDLTAYRLIQEALRRAQESGHAERASVGVDYGPGEVRIVVTDDGAATGRRLLGLRERVAVYGGELQAAEPDGGGWRVAARLPVGASA
jgi:signal transduction histidine kinase